MIATSEGNPRRWRDMDEAPEEKTQREIGQCGSILGSRSARINENSFSTMNPFAMPELILASTSPLSQRTAGAAAVPFRCEAPNVDEAALQPRSSPKPTPNKSR